MADGSRLKLPKLEVWTKKGFHWFLGHPLQLITSKRIPGITKSYCLDKFPIPYSFCKLRLLVGILTFVCHLNIYLKNLCNTRMFMNTTTSFLDQNMIKCALFWEYIDPTKADQHIDFSNLQKMWIFEWKSQTQNFRRNFYARRIFYTPPRFFLNSKLTFKHFYFLNHVNSTKIEKNIYPSDPPLKPPF